MSNEPSVQGGRPLTLCQSCHKPTVTAAVIAGAFVYLRCQACGFVFALEDRRCLVRPDHQGKVFAR